MLGLCCLHISFLLRLIRSTLTLNQFADYDTTRLHWPTLTETCWLTETRESHYYLMTVLEFKSGHVIGLYLSYGVVTQHLKWLSHDYFHIQQCSHKWKHCVSMVDAHASHTHVVSVLVNIGHVFLWFVAKVSPQLRTSIITKQESGTWSAVTAQGQRPESSPDIHKRHLPCSRMCESCVCWELIYNGCPHILVVHFQKQRKKDSPFPLDFAGGAVSVQKTLQRRVLKGRNAWNYIIQLWVLHFLCFKWTSRMYQQELYQRSLHSYKS